MLQPTLSVWSKRRRTPSSTAQSRFAPTDPTWRDLREILAASKRGTAFTGNLLAFARQLPSKRERVSLHELVEEVVQREVVRRCHEATVIADRTSRLGIAGIGRESPGVAGNHRESPGISGKGRE
jgi:hypothetical protein